MTTIKKTLFKHAENYKMGSFTNAQSLTHRWQYNLFVIHHLKKTQQSMILSSTDLPKYVQAFLFY